MTRHSLEVAVIGAGIGGLAAAIALRRQGHWVSLYERYDFAGEVGASLSCAKNGTMWLDEWKVPIEEMDPVILRSLCLHDYKSGEPINDYDLSDYKEKWGHEYLMFHRQDMHRTLLKTAVGLEGDGPPCKLYVNHRVETVESEDGRVVFTNGRVITADLIVGSDGIRSTVRGEIGVEAKTRPAPLAAYRCNILASTVDELGLHNFAARHGIDYWGGFPQDDRSQYYKIVLTGCRAGSILSFYVFMPTQDSPQRKEGYRYAEVPVEEITAPFKGKLDDRVVQLLEHSFDRMPWRLYIHEPYTHWARGKVCILGDAAHPMMPNQSQGAVQALEDAAALGIIFSDRYRYEQDVETGLRLYEQVRKPRATRVQQASLRATENINERIGFSTQPYSQSKIATTGKLTTDEMNLYDMYLDVTLNAPDFPARSSWYFRAQQDREYYANL